MSAKALGAGIVLAVFAAGVCLVAQSRLPWHGEETQAEHVTHVPGDAAGIVPADAGYKEYALSEPGSPATPEERARAVRVIEYANSLDEILSGPCSQDPARVLAGIMLYDREYDVFLLSGKAAPADCLRKALQPPDDVFSAESVDAINMSLTDMDNARAAMRKDYEELCVYVADTAIVDNGVRGEKLTHRIREQLMNYVDASQRFHAAVDREAGAAQDTLLRDHPLRDHVACAMAISAAIRQQAEVIGLSEPDPALLDKPLADLDEKILTAGRLPFPIPGVVEMHYRHYLKEARNVVASMRKGQTEAFHPGVRAEINQAWQACAREYNLFVDAVTAR